MLKTVSSITNAIGALNYKGTWNASTNTPTLASGVGTKGDYYQVSVAGATALDGISNWGVGDVVAFNGATWQRIEGGADLNGVNLSVSGTSTLSALSASTALALNAQKEIVSVTNTGTGNNVLATTPSFSSTAGVGGATAAASGAGITFPATQSASSDANTLDDYEEGTWTPVVADAASGGNEATYDSRTGNYTKIGNIVRAQCRIILTSKGSMTSGNSVYIRGMPFASASNNINRSLGVVNCDNITFASGYIVAPMVENVTSMTLQNPVSNTGANNILVSGIAANTFLIIDITYQAA